MNHEDAIPDSMTVNMAMLEQAHKRVAAMGPEDALALLGEREPALAAWIDRALIAIAGKMGLSGVDSAVIAGSYVDNVAMAVAMAEGIRSGHLAIWGNSIAGTPLESLLKPTGEEEQEPIQD